MSKIMPSAEQTGFSKGNNDSEQQKKGNLAMGTFTSSFLPPHSCLCSFAVMNKRSLLCRFFPIVFETKLNLRKKKIINNFFFITEVF
jgi:hypothetical protein